MEENREESVGASSENNSGEETGGSSPENEAGSPGNKRLKLDKKEDRISALPDALIHHILSLLPSTKEAIRTGILSKRWKSQWTRVPVLIFDSTDAFRHYSEFESSARLQHLLATKILGQLQHAKLLEIGHWFIKILSALELKGRSSPLSNCKCLTLDGTNFDEFLPGIVCAIRSSPMLEKLIIKLQLDQFQRPSVSDFESRNYRLCICSKQETILRKRW
ncbi:F-box family protein [Euphorbia peplus]|nr:F-box family protein [Euphorbia peplus]